MQDASPLTYRPISAVLVVLNEEKILPLTLEALRGVADEILVADTGSTDNTIEIARQYGARTVQLAWQGFAATKNEANKMAQHDWILSLDADEVVQTELREAIIRLKHNAQRGDNYSLIRATYYLGKRIRYGEWGSDSKFRLFDRRHTHWKGEYVHEELHTGGARPALLKEGRLLHYTFTTLAEHAASQQRYAALSAGEILARGKKITAAKVCFSPLFSFFKEFFIEGNILNGRRGFFICAMGAYYRLLKYGEVYMARRAKDEDPRSPHYKAS